MATPSLSSRRPAASILLVAIVLIVARCHVASSAMEDGFGGLMMDHFLRLNPRAGRRFLAEDAAIRRGDRCDPVTDDICSGTEAKDGTQLLLCCGHHCRNVLGDRNNCGTCGSKCKFGQLCCNGKCAAVAYDVDNCGRCGKACEAGVRCEFGTCGYA